MWEEGVNSTLLVQKAEEDASGSQSRHASGNNVRLEEIER